LYDLGVDGRTILKLDIQEIEREEVDGSQMSGDYTRGRLLYTWQAVVKTMKNSDNNEMAIDDSNEMAIVERE
jgi:hypothetical protein